MNHRLLSTLSLLLFAFACRSVDATLIGSYPGPHPASTAEELTWLESILAAENITHPELKYLWKGNRIESTAAGNDPYEEESDYAPAADDDFDADGADGTIFRIESGGALGFPDDGEGTGTIIWSGDPVFLDWDGELFPFIPAFYIAKIDGPNAGNNVYSWMDPAEFTNDFQASQTPGGPIVGDQFGTSHVTVFGYHAEIPPPPSQRGMPEPSSYLVWGLIAITLGGYRRFTRRQK